MKLRTRVVRLPTDVTETIEVDVPPTETIVAVWEPRAIKPGGLWITLVTVVLGEET